MSSSLAPEERYVRSNNHAFVVIIMRSALFEAP
jgi:hypothetical protein